MKWKLTYKHKLPRFYQLGHPKFSIDEVIEFFYQGRYIGNIIFYCLNSSVLTITRIYLTPNYRGKNFQKPMLDILGNLYDSINTIEIIINENLKKYREVEFHYNNLNFKKVKDSEDKYFCIEGEKIRLFKMIKYVNK
jgi:hypothetical protein